MLVNTFSIYFQSKMQSKDSEVLRYELGYYCSFEISLYIHDAKQKVPRRKSLEENP